MGNLRALLHVTLGMADSIASQLSGGIWFLGIGSIIGARLRRRLPIEACWGLAVLAYLLFCPHVTSTEELQLVVVLTLFARPRTAVTNAVRRTALGVILVMLYGAGTRVSERAPCVRPVRREDPARRLSGGAMVSCGCRWTPDALAGCVRAP